MYEETSKPLRNLARSEPLAERARMMQTGAADAPNGIRLVFVSVDNAADTATLDVHFYNPNYLDQISVADNQSAKLIFQIFGGSRLRGGNAEGQVQVSAIAEVAGEPVLRLTVQPIGDYSTYTLALYASAIDAADPPFFDPLFSEISFKFRPGCFNANCAPEWEIAPEPFKEPTIDYLAKDYDSFRLTMIAAMMQRVPEWEATSEADLDQVLLELFSAAADELSDYQDRVMNEAFLASARKRVSVARHARLMDYHIHQGNQASTRLALEIADTGQRQYELLDDLKVWAGESVTDAAGKKTDAETSVVFHSRHAETQTVHLFLNRIGLYTWSDSITALKAGSTQADLMLYGRLNLDGTPSQEINHGNSTDADEVRDLFGSEKIKYLLIEERLNPVTGAVAGFDPTKRQLLRLLKDGAETLYDPVNGKYFVRVRWEKKDALKRDYCFTVDCEDGKIENVSLFHGNLVKVFYGRKTKTIFKEPGAQLIINPALPLELYYERTRWGAICRLPQVALAYLKTVESGDGSETGERSDKPPFSTLEIEIDGNQWDEVPSLIHSDDSDEMGDHFVVETDENRRSLIRFGNGVNGKELPENAVVNCEYQYGEPLEGNIGADTLINFDVDTVVALPNTLEISRCWNPFDITDATDREPVAEIIRRVPEAYRARQLRAVTLADYVKEAQKVKGVSRAAARYSWTGSWRTVRVCIDADGTNELSDELRRRVAARLEAVRLIGEDIEIRPPKFVPLEIEVKLCAAPDVWIEDIEFILEQEFSAGWLPDGRKGFFHPQLWTFGQPLYESQITGRALQVKGVEHIIGVSIKRFNEPTAGTTVFTTSRFNEIIEVLSDPNALERGFIKFEIKGGRQ